MERSSIDYLCYCGLYCRSCTLITKTPQTASKLRDILKADGWEGYGEYVYAGFGVFWDILQKMSNLAETSSLCRGGCGDPECKIRECAQGKGIDVCALCEQYPCELVSEFDKKYKVIRRNNDRIREIGLDAWFSEMDQRAEQGEVFQDMFESL